MNHDLQAAYRILGVLERSKGLLDSIFDSLTGVSVLCDSDGRILRANQTAAELVGFNLETVLGRDVRLFFDSDDHALVSAKIGELARGDGGGFDAEFSLVDQTKRTRSFQWRLDRLPLPKEEDTVLLSLVGQEITDLKLALRSVLELEKDLEFAGVVQALTLPQDPVAENEFWSMAAHYEPASKAGGDWWRFEQDSAGRARFLLGDVTGHGLGAGMVTALLTGAYEVLRARDTFLAAETLFGEFNRCLRGLRGQSYWMTMMLLDLDSSSHTLRWWSAAAPPAWILRPNGERDELGYESMPLGSGKLELGSGQTSFHPGDRLFAATDGLFEVRPELSTTSAARRYAKVLREGFGETQATKERLKLEWDRLRDGQPAQDDLAFFIIDRKPAVSRA